MMDLGKKKEDEVAVLKDDLKFVTESRDRHIQRASSLLADLCDVTEDYIREKDRHQKTKIAMWCMTAAWLLMFISWALGKML